MNLRKQLLTNNNAYKNSTKITVKGIMWHSTGSNNPNLRRYVQPDDGLLGVNTAKNHWNTAKPDGRSVCVHAFIGKLKDGSIATYQTLPWDTKGWHCGGTANSTHIGFEICEDALNSSSYFNAVYKEACELTAYLCTMYHLDPMGDGVIICHQEGFKRGMASNHADVLHWFNKFGKTMSDVRKDVATIMNTTAGIPNKGTVVDKSTPVLYKVQAGAFRSKEQAAQQLNKIIKAGFDASIVKIGCYYKIQCGAFSIRKNAEELVKKLRAAGFNSFIY